MKIAFRESIPLPPEAIYSYFRTPADWVRLYGAFGAVEDRGDGWFAVPIGGFPFPLVAKNVDVEPRSLVRWRFRGFWRGEGLVRFTARGQTTIVEGYERISLRWLPVLSPWVERYFLRRPFEAIWAQGWRRLRRQAHANRATVDEA